MSMTRSHSKVELVHRRARARSAPAKRREDSKQQHHEQRLPYRPRDMSVSESLRAIAAKAERDRQKEIAPF